MITYIHGILSEKTPTHIVVETAGVGYGIHVSLSTFHQLPKAGASVKVLTYLHVREDLQQLYGFATEEERKIFLQLIGISGIGPKVAVGILSGLSANEFKEAIIHNHMEVLTAIPGVGKKTAQRLIVELGEKLGGELQIDKIHPSPDLAGVSPEAEEAVLALVSLGFKRPNAIEAVKKAVQNGKKNESVENLIKQALRVAG